MADNRLLYWRRGPFLMALLIVRSVFLLVAASVAVSVVYSTVPAEGNTLIPVVTFAGMMLAAVAVIFIDMMIPRKRIDVVSTVYFGLLIGLFLTYVTGVALSPLMEQSELSKESQNLVQLVIGMIVCYTCVSVLMQTKDDFRFIIPYVEFSKEIKGLKPYILDTSAVIDGRIADVVETQFTDNQLVIPRFVLVELQNIADSSDRLKRSRGRRGLDVLSRLQSSKVVDLLIHEHELPDMDGQSVDMKLVLLAKHLNGKVVTGDYNLNKVAKLHSVDVINLNDIANALKPVFLPGEHVVVQIVKAGEEAGQGVGYLDDGTMIVVEGGRDHINQNVQIAVTSVLQTSAGRMVFGRFELPTDSA